MQKQNQVFDKQIWVFDLEANSLDPDTIWCIVVKQLGVRKGVCFINDDYFDRSDLDLDFLQKERLSEFPKWARENSSGRLVGANFIDYDDYVLNKLLGIDVEALGWEVRDTLILSRITDVTRPGGHSVEAWGQRLGITKVEIGDEQWAKFDPVMIPRCRIDVEIQEGTYEHLRKHELAGFPLQSILLEQETQRIISQQRRDGVFIDVEKAHRLFTTTKRLADEIQRDIRLVFPPKAKLIREYNPKVLKDGTLSSRTLGGLCVDGPYSRIEFADFNLDSPPQRVERLLSIGWKPTSFTPPSERHPKGQPTFSEEDLENLPEDAPPAVRLLGQYLMLRSKQRVANQWLDMADAKGYIHGTVNPLGARTHRMAHLAPNLGNIARTEVEKSTGSPIKGVPGRFGWESRDTFTIETPKDTCLVGVDASGIQLRALAHYAEDADYIKKISDPLFDPHAYHGEALGSDRTKAKTWIYAWLLGSGNAKSASIIGCTLDEVVEKIKQFYLKFPFLKEVKKRFDKDGERGYTIALDGRPIRIVEPHKALSVGLQSFEAIVMKRAQVDYHKTLKKDLGIWFKQRLIVHDEFLTEAKRKEAQVVGEVMKTSIVNAGLILNSKCPLAAGMKIGDTWAVCH